MCGDIEAHCPRCKEVNYDVIGSCGEYGDFMEECRCNACGSEFNMYYGLVSIELVEDV